MSLYALIPKWVLVGALVAVGAFALHERSERLDTLETLTAAQTRLSDIDQAHLRAALKRRDRELEREAIAQETADAFLEDIKNLDRLLAGERAGADSLRDQIRAFQRHRPEGAPTPAECRREADQSTTLGQLLEQADDLLGEGESLAAELTRAAEQHAAEVRALKSRVEQDRAP